MLRLIKNELNKILLPVSIATLVYTILHIVLTLTLYKSYALNYDLQAWEVASEPIDFFFPLFVIIPICWLMYYERKNEFLLYTMPRIDKKKYLGSKWIAAMISAFFIAFIPNVLAAIVALYIKKPIIPMVQSPFTHVYLNLFLNSPMLYALLLSFWKGLIAILLINLGFLLSMYIKNIFVILTAPFVYVVLENFILSTLGIPAYRLITSYNPASGLHPRSITTFSPLIGPIILIIFTFLLWKFFSKYKKLKVYEV